MNVVFFGGIFFGLIVLVMELCLLMKMFIKLFVLFLVLFVVLVVLVWVDFVVFIVLILEQVLIVEVMLVLVVQLKILQVDVVSVCQVQCGIGQVDLLQVLVDGLGYEYCFVVVGKDDGQIQCGQVVLIWLLIVVEFGFDQLGLNYLCLDDGCYIVVVYIDVGVGVVQLLVLVICFWLGVLVVLFGVVVGELVKVVGFDLVCVVLEVDVSYFSDGFQVVSSVLFKIEGSSLCVILLILVYVVDKYGEKLWMDIIFNVDVCVVLLLKVMIEDEKFQMLYSYFGLGKDGGLLLEGVVGLVGFVLGVLCLGILLQQLVDVGVGVINLGGICLGDFVMVMFLGLFIVFSWNCEVVFVGGVIMGCEVWQQCFNILLLGSVNLQCDLCNGCNFEYVGEDLLLVGLMVGVLIQGVQSQYVIFLMKYFVLNDMEIWCNFYDVCIGEQVMYELDLLVFEIVFEVGCLGVVMCLYNKINGIYGCENGYLMNQVLKQEWKFFGFVMFDWGGVYSGLKVVLVGLDQQLVGEVFDVVVFFDELLCLVVYGGVVLQVCLNDMVMCILCMMFLYGNFDNLLQYQKVDVEVGFVVVQCMVEEGSVLLCNEGNLLLLVDSVKCIVIIGGYVDKGVIGGGGLLMVGVIVKGINVVLGVLLIIWLGLVIFYLFLLLELLCVVCLDVIIEYVDGINVVVVVRVVVQVDVVIVFVIQWVVELVDLLDMQLLDNQDVLILVVVKVNLKIVLVLEINGLVCIFWLVQVLVMLQVWYLGIRGGEGIVVLLIGQVNLFGCLLVIWVMDELQLLCLYIDGFGFKLVKLFGDVFDFDIEGVNVGYKWMVVRGLILIFVFGYGLFYILFVYENLKVSVEGLCLVVSVDICNIGKCVGVDVVQLYLKLLVGSIMLICLIGYDKVNLQLGEQYCICIEVELKMLVYYDVQVCQWKIYGGIYQVQLLCNVVELLQSVDVQLVEQVLC